MDKIDLNKKTFAAIAGLLIAIVAITQIGIMTNDNEIHYKPLTILPEPQNANAIPMENASCLPDSLSALETQPEIKFRTPHILPIGFTQKAIDHAERGWITLFYWDKPMCPFEYTPRDYSLKGAITITAYYNDPSGTPINASDYVNGILSDPDNKLYAKWHPVTLGGNLGGNEAVGTESFEGRSLTYLDGKLVDEKPIPSPAMIYFIHKGDNTEYRISGNMPLEDLIKVVESIK